MPGPPPSRNPRRRNARPEWRRLPSSGRPGEPPPWPLPGRTTRIERELWAELWTSPQAVAWQALGWVRVVARYTRITIAAEKRGALGVVMTEARQLEDRIGLNPKAMKSLMWEISDEAPASDAPGDEVVALDAYRARFG